MPASVITVPHCTVALYRALVMSVPGFIKYNTRVLYTTITQGGTVKMNPPLPAAQKLINKSVPCTPPSCQRQASVDRHADGIITCGTCRCKQGCKDADTPSLTPLLQHIEA